LLLRPPRVVVAALDRRSVCVHESREKGSNQIELNHSETLTLEKKDPAGHPRFSRRTHHRRRVGGKPRAIILAGAREKAEPPTREVTPPRDLASGLTVKGTAARPLDGGAPILGWTRAPARGPTAAPPHRLRPSHRLLATATAPLLLPCGCEKMGRREMKLGFGCEAVAWGFDSPM
jgi:hypothetical protein